MSSSANWPADIASAGGLHLDELRFERDVELLLVPFLVVIEEVVVLDLLLHGPGRCGG
jgi:hypothetical protein